MNSAIDPADRSEEPGAARGQILVMFAVFLVGLLGMLGLATDLGVAFAQRRTMQNAADAGALAGAHVIARAATTGTALSAQANVEAVVTANAMDLGAIQAVECSYITDSGAVLGSCAAIVPAAATGVSVRVVEEHPTFFMQVVPGAPEAVETAATAKAHVRRFIPPSDGPYLPCARKTVLAAGGTMDMLTQVDGVWTVNQSAIGQTFVLHGPQAANCNASSSRYKGVADQAQNIGRVAPNWFFYNEGDTVNPVQSDVEGADGCKSHREVNNCVVFVPIAVDDPSEPGNSRKLWVVTYGAFYVTKPKSNETHGMLLGSYTVYGGGHEAAWGWHRGYAGPILIRLSA